MRHIETREFTVVLCGFSASEEKVLNNALRLSAVRSRRYSLWAGREPPMLAIVNEDRPVGPEAWRTLVQRFRDFVLPVVRVGTTDRDDVSYQDVAQLFFKRPVLANRILKVLDQLVADAYQFIPEVVISDDAPIDTLGDAQLLTKEPRAAAHAGPRVLVIDDCDSVRKMMEVRLAATGCRIDFAETGEKGLTLAREHPFALIFLDVVLPGMNGYQVCRVLKQEIKVKCPIVMLTSKSSRVDKLRGSLAAVDYYLTKPLAMKDFNRVLERYLGSGVPEDSVQGAGGSVPRATQRNDTYDLGHGTALGSKR